MIRVCACCYVQRVSKGDTLALALLGAFHFFFSIGREKKQEFPFVFSNSNLNESSATKIVSLKMVWCNVTVVVRITYYVTNSYRFCFFYPFSSDCDAISVKNMHF